MSLNFPNGAVFGFSTVTAAAVTASAVTNASPAIATVATGGFTEDDVVIMTSGWSAVNNAAAKVGDVTAGSTNDTIQLLGVNATNTTLYPAGQAAMTLAKASTFVDFSQQDGAGVSTSGGEQQFWTGQLLEDISGRQIQVPTFKNAKVLTIPLFFDPDASWYEKAKEADAAKEAIVLRCKLPNGDELYRYGYLSFDDDPSIAANTPMGNTATFTALGGTTLVKGA